MPPKEELDRSNFFKARGFEAGEPVYWIEDYGGLKSLKRHFFSSGVDIWISAIVGGEPRLDIVFDSAKRIWQQDEENPFGCRTQLGWLLEGDLLIKPGERVPVRVFIDEGTDWYIQRIPAEPDPDGIVRYGGR